MNLKGLGPLLLLLGLACERNAATQWTYGGEAGAVSAPAMFEGRIAWGTSGGLHLTTLDGEKVCVQRELGAVDAAPVAEGTTIWAGTRDREIIAMDERCALRWRQSVPGRVAGGLTLSAGVLYAATHAGRVVALDAQSGDALWVHPSADSPPYRALVAGPPRLIGERLYVARLEGGVAVLDRSSGELRALIPSGPISAPMSAGDGRVWVHDELGALFEIDGEEVSVRFDIEVPGTAPPLLTERRVYVASSERRVLAVNRQNGLTLWTFETRGPVRGAMVLFRGLIVAAGGSGDGRLYVLDPATGAGRPLFSGGARFASDLMTGDGRLLAANEDGKLYAFTTVSP